MNCPSCGKPTREGASFCGECGQKLPGVAIAPGVAEAPVETPPLRRPPPPPDDEPTIVAESGPPQIESVESAATPAAIPDVSPILVAPPPPSNAPKVVEVVPFGTTAEVPVRERETSGISITAPPGIGETPLADIGPADATPESLDETRASVRRRAGNHWRLVLADARQIEVTGAVLVGRDPAANLTWPDALMLAIDDDAHSMSKTHAVFEADAAGLWVTDLDSTNGVVITQPDGSEEDLEPNVRGRIQPGADVELGDYIIQVEKE